MTNDKTASQRAVTVKVPAGWVYPIDTPEATVTVHADGRVVWDGRDIGYVWKGTRTYSPPTHRGSRIVRYHKQVAEWHAHPSRRGYSPKHRCDSRRDVLQRLIADALSTD